MIDCLYKILVVDDNENNLFTIKSLIEETINATVISISSPLKALKFLINESIDLIILDVNIGNEMDGFDLAKIIKSRKKTEHIPIVFLTAAYLGDDFKKKGFEIGAVDYLTKPIDDFLLINRINVYLKVIEKERNLNKLLEKKVQEQTEELRLAIKAAEIANNAKSTFLANISHELRTPLNILLGATQIIQYYLTNDKALDRNEIGSKVKIQLQNCYRLIRLVNNLIDITKMDSGNFVLNVTTCNIVEIVEAISTSVVEYAALKQISLIFDTDNEEIFLSCDLDAIERIVLNLLSNAIKFTTGGGSIYINIATFGSYVQISVKDTGIGIAKDKQHIIFERFKQVDNLLTRQSEGSGIGLNVVKSLVEMHGGNIHLESCPGQGSEFIIKLPFNNSLKPNKDTNDSNKSSSVIQKIEVEFSDIYFWKL